MPARFVIEEFIVDGKMLAVNGSETQTCRLCCMEIPKLARKCRYCQSFVKPFSLHSQHPLLIGALISLPLLLMMVAFGTFFDSGENFQDYKGQINVVESEMVFGDLKAGPTVAVLGSIRNESAVPWKELHFHAEFFDGGGKRIDVGQKGGIHLVHSCGRNLVIQTFVPS